MECEIKEFNIVVLVKHHLAAITSLINRDGRVSEVHSKEGKGREQEGKQSNAVTRSRLGTVGISLYFNVLT